MPEMSQFMTPRREVIFAGNVQGVGFRYTAAGIAADYAVAGFVRNLRDGRVQIVAEGQVEEIDRFLAALQVRMHRYIRTTTTSEQAPTGEFSGFEIRY